MNLTLKAARERVEQFIAVYRQTNHPRPKFRPGEYVSLPIADIRLILAALDEQEWRPIETAPRDGTDVLICGPFFSRAFISQYDSGRWRTGVSAEKLQMATHWRPLTAPPVEVKG